MRNPGLAHRVLIKEIAIHSQPFSLVEISKACNMSKTTTQTLLNRLLLIGYLTKSSKAFSHRYWRVSTIWTTSEEVIANYELWRLARSNENAFKS